MPTLQLFPEQAIHYRDINPEGKRVVLLLHGLGADGSSWRLQFPALQESGFHTLTPDTPGFGESPYPGGGTSVKKMTDSMAKLLNILDISSVFVVGISMGGAIALQLSLDYPKLVEKLVLINSFAHLHVNNPRLWPYFALRFILLHTLGLPTQARAVAKRIFPHPEQEELRQEIFSQIVQADPAGYRAAMRALFRFNVQDRLNEIHCPTLLITGDADTTVPAENQSALANSIQNARQVVISDAGHGVIAEKPEIINKHLIEFLLEV